MVWSGSQGTARVICPYGNPSGPQRLLFACSEGTSSAKPSLYFDRIYLSSNVNTRPTRSETFYYGGPTEMVKCAGIAMKDATTTIALMYFPSSK